MENHERKRLEPAFAGPESSRFETKTAEVFRIGSRIGSFVIRAELGRGGMGIVYLAEDTRLRRDVALKILPVTLANEVRQHRFWREARAAARINHPNVTAVFEVGQDAGSAYIAMEYIEGRTLRALLKEQDGAPLPIHEALRIALAIADGLENAHVAGIVHRDLKPENVMLAHCGRVKLLDFGLAKVAAFPEPDPALECKEGWDSLLYTEHLTIEGRVVGTPCYMSPEQVAGKPLDLRSDLFSLGIILYEMVTGVRPFQGHSSREVLTAILRDEPAAASGRNPLVPPEFDRLLHRCLAKQPEARCEGAFEIRAVLAKLLAVQTAPVSAERAGPASARVCAPIDPQETTCSVSRELDSPASMSKEAHALFARDERALIAVVVSDVGVKISGKESAEMAAEFLREVHRRGGSAELLPDGIFAATFAARLVATDQAAQSARCALALRRIAPALPMALAMERVDRTERLLTAELLSRAKKLLAPPSGPLTDSSDQTIALDEMTAGLLGSHFDVKSSETGPRLLSELPIPHMAHTLLGRHMPCVGRDRELATLVSLFSECVEEPLGRSVLVIAPPGRGKSRLAHEMIRILSRQRGPEISIWMSSGDCDGAGSALGLLRRALRAECGLQDDESGLEQRDKVERRVRRSVPESDRQRVTEFLGEILHIPFPDDKSASLRSARQDAELMNEQMRRAFLDFLAAETTQRPLLIVLEDLHWGDLPTVRFIDAALRVHSDKPWMVLALARPEVHDRFPQLWTARNFHQIHLKKLSPKAAEQLLRKVLGQAASQTLVQRLINLADGLPLYLEELIRATALGQTRTLPVTVVAMVQARLMALGEDARRLLRVASVFGEVFWQSAVEGIIGDATADLLSQLVDCEIIVRHLDSRFPGEGEYAFRHALLREGAYATLTDADRVLGHRLAAEWLELHDEQNPLRIAEHFERGERPLLAAGYYQEAAGQALYAGDVDTAIACGERGIGCGATGSVREHLWGILCDAYAWRFDYGRALPIAQELMRHAQPGSAAYFTGAKLLMGVELFGGKWNEFVDVVDAAMKCTPQPAAVGVLANMIISCVTILPLIGQAERGAAYLPKLRTLCDGAGKESVVARGWMHFALAFTAIGPKEDPWSALREAEASRACFAEAGFRKGYGNAQIVVGMSAWLLGARERAESELLDPSASDLDLPEMAAHHAAILVDLMLARGDAEGARSFANERVLLRRAQQNRSEEGHGRYALARALYALGDLAAAEREAQLSAELLVVPVYRLWSLSLLAIIRRSQGRPKEARALAEQALRGCESLRNFSYRGAEIRLTYAEALEAVGEKDQARHYRASAVEPILLTASRIDDPKTRESYLRNVPVHARALQHGTEHALQFVHPEELDAARLHDP